MAMLPSSDAAVVDVAGDVMSQVFDDPLFAGAEEAVAALSCDFYGAPDDVRRGTVLGPAVTELLDHTSSSLEDELHDWSGIGRAICRWERHGLHKELMAPATPWKAAKETAIMADSFQGSDMPPRCPTDTFFRLKDSTLFMKCIAPVEIANRLLGFFLQEDGVSVDKVSPKKFSMKVTNCSMNGACKLKVRMYWRPPGSDTDSFAVEFHRLSGDHEIFTALYKKAANSLEHKDAPQVKDAPADNQAQAPLAMESSGPTSNDVELLLDLALASSQVDLQAEAAAALVRIAPAVQELTLSGRGPKVLEVLLESQHFEVVERASHLLLALASNPHLNPAAAARLLFDGPVAAAAIASAQWKDQQLGLRLARGVRLAVAAGAWTGGRSGTFTCARDGKLRAALSRALLPSKGEGQARVELCEALWLLDHAMPMTAS